MTKGDQRIKDRLTESPMCFVGDTTVVKHKACLAPGEKAGKKVTLRYVVNYNEFHTCAACKVSARR